MFASLLRKRVIIVQDRWKTLFRIKCDKSPKDTPPKTIDEDKCEILKKELQKQQAKSDPVKAENRALGTSGDDQTGEAKPLAIKAVKGSEDKELESRLIKGSNGKGLDLGSDESGQWHRPVRQQQPKVRLGFLPDDWFTFFYFKTGVTGPYVFMTTVSTYLISKEIYVMNHEYYSALSVVIILYFSCKYLGQPLAAYLDKEVDEYEALWNEGRNNEKSILSSQIEDELNLQKSSEGQLLLVEAKRENVGLQYEAAYRKRLVTVHEAVLKRLNYQVRHMQIRKRYIHENAVEWIVNQVVKSYTEKYGKEDVEICIECLKQLAAKEVTKKD